MRARISRWRDVVAVYDCGNLGVDEMEGVLQRVGLPEQAQRRDHQPRVGEAGSDDPLDRSDEVSS